MRSGILSAILFSIYSDILSGILSGIIYSDILSAILSGIYADVLSAILSGIFSHIFSAKYFSHPSWHFCQVFWQRAQTEPELPIGFSSVRAQTAMEPVICLGCRGSKMIPLELALAVRSRPFGAHRQVGGRRKKQEEKEEGRRRNRTFR